MNIRLQSNLPTTLTHSYCNYSHAYSYSSSSCSPPKSLNIPTSKLQTNKSKALALTLRSLKSGGEKEEKASSVSLGKKEKGMRRSLIVGGIVMILITGMKALAWGGGGPLLEEEEFWDNVRRYALYALTVSTGALYAILHPILELLKNPISAVLLILIFAATFFLLSQLLSAMVGVSHFSYDYSY